MPKIRTLRTRKPPAGWDLIEPTLEELNMKMREAEREPHEGKRKCESLWPIFRIHHQRSRYIYDMFYKKQAISRELFDYCCQEGYADRNLIAKWRKPGFEKLCCLNCIQHAASNFGTACVCRVPSKDLEDGKVVECVQCGCRGCASEIESWKRATGRRESNSHDNAAQTETHRNNRRRMKNDAVPAAAPPTRRTPPITLSHAIWIQTRGATDGPLELLLVTPPSTGTTGESSTRDATHAAPTRHSVSCCLDATGRRMTFVYPSTLHEIETTTRSATRIGTLENSSVVSSSPTFAFLPDVAIEETSVVTTTPAASQSRRQVTAATVASLWGPQETRSVCCLTLGSVYEWTGHLGAVSHLSRIPMSLPVTQVSCGAHHYALLTTSDTVFVSGNNAYGQLGKDAKAFPATTTPILLPIPSQCTPKLVACGGQMTLVASSESPGVIVQIGLGNPSPQDVFLPPPFHSTEPWRIEGLAAGEDFGLVSLVSGRHSPHDVASLVSWGPTNADGRLGWSQEPDDERMEYHPLQAKHVSLNQCPAYATILGVYAAGTGAAVHAVVRSSQTPSSSSRLLRTSIFVWGSNEWNSRKTTCSLPQELELIHRISASGVEQQCSSIDIISVCCSPTAIACVVLEVKNDWRFFAGKSQPAFQKPQNLQIPALKLAGSEFQALDRRETEEGYESSNTSKSHQSPRSSHAAEEFWKRWGGQTRHSQDPHAVPVPTVDNSLSHHDTPTRRLSMQLHQNDTIISTIENVSSRQYLPRTEKEAQVGQPRRHAFLQTQVRPKKKTVALHQESSSSMIQSALWGRLTSLGSSLSLQAIMGKETAERGKSLVKHDPTARLPEYVDALHLPWKETSLRSLPSLIIRFEAFRNACINTWTDYLFGEVYGVTVGNHAENTNSAKPIMQLRKLYLDLLNRIRSVVGFEAARNMFDVSIQSLSSRLLLTQDKAFSDRTRQAWFHIRRALIAQWPTVYVSTSVIGQPSLERMLSASITSTLEDRLLHLRRNAYTSVTGSELQEDDDVPAQQWEITLDELSDIEAINSVSLLPRPSSPLGRVFVARLRGEMVAVKLTPVLETPDHVLHRRLREIFIHETLRHSHIVTFIAAVIRGPVIALVTEWMQRGTLWELLHESSYPLSWLTRAQLASNIASGLTYLHHLGPILHRDVKSSNVFLTGGDFNATGMIAKLGDFELARRPPQGLAIETEHSSMARHYLLTSLGVGSSDMMMSIGEDHAIVQNPTVLAPSESFKATANRNPEIFMSSAVGSFPWMAPELYNDEALADRQQQTRELLQRQCNSAIESLKQLSSTDFLMPKKSSSNAEDARRLTSSFPPCFYTEKTDVYSYGVVLWELCFRTPPYLGLDGHSVAQLSREHGTLRLPLFDAHTLPRPVRALIAACCHSDPRCRPDMTVIMEGLKAWELQLQLDNLGGLGELFHAARDTMSQALSTLVTHFRQV